MANWTHSDWITETSRVTRIAKLRAHIKEVSDKLTAEMSGDSGSHATANYRTYLDTLLKALEREDPAGDGGTAFASGGGAGFVRARPPF